MNTLGDALHSAFAADEARERERVHDSRRTIRSIRHRRTARAGAAAAVGIGVIAVGATRLPAVDTTMPGGPDVTCTPSPWALGNARAFGALEYVGRSYIDVEAGDFVFVHADGETEELTRDADGSVWLEIDGIRTIVWAETMSSRPGRHAMDWVRTADGLQGVGAPIDPSRPLPDTWKWNVEVPTTTPAGVDPEGLSMLLLTSMFGSGGTLEPGAVPKGATVTMAAHGVGSTWTVPVAPGYAGPGPQQTGDERLNSLDLVVTLADGSTYTLTAHHDPNATGPEGCVAVSPSAG